MMSDKFKETPKFPHQGAKKRNKDNSSPTRILPDSELAQPADRQPPNSSKSKDYIARVAEKGYQAPDAKGSEQDLKWMEKLALDSMLFLAKRRGMRLQAVREELLYNQGMTQMIEQMFGTFTSYAFEFNRSIGWHALHVTCTEPTFVTEVLKYNQFREPLETVSNFRARLSTRYESLVLRGSRNRIEVLLLPVDKVIGLSKAELGYKPLVELTAQINEESQVDWYVGKEQLSDEDIEELCQELFTRLIEKTREQSTGEVAP